MTQNARSKETSHSNIKLSEVGHNQVIRELPFADAPEARSSSAALLNCIDTIHPQAVSMSIRSSSLVLFMDLQSGGCTQGYNDHQRN